VIQGNVSNNGMSTIRFERKGDLLSYVYLVPTTALPPKGTALLNGAPRLPRLNSSSVVKSLMTRIPPTPPSSLQCSQLQTLPSPSQVTSSVVPTIPVSTHSALLSVKTSKPPFPSLLSSTTMWNSASLGAPRLPPISGMSTPTMCTWIPKSVSTLPPLHKT